MYQYWIKRRFVKNVEACCPNQFLAGAGNRNRRVGRVGGRVDSARRERERPTYEREVTPT